LVNGGVVVPEPQPTIYDVAQAAGVSIATVSRAINAIDSVRPSTRARVLRAMEQLRFVPNANAQGLSKGKAWIIGLVFVHAPVTDDELEVEGASLLYSDYVIRGAEARAAANGYSLLLRGAGENHPTGIASLHSLTGSVDGLVLLDQVLPESEAVELAERIPVVLLAGSGTAEGVTTIRVDNERSMRELADHFVDVHGLTRGGFIAGLDASPDSVARERAFRARFAERGGQVRDVDVLRSDWTSIGAERAIEARVALGEPLPEVFACANDQTAVGAIHALQQAGVRVPEDVAVSGFDDITLTRYMKPSLTTIRQSGAMLGEAAVDALLAQLSGGERETRDIVLPSSIVVRDSCGCAARADEGRVPWTLADKAVGAAP
jgi:LacI family transcriptional regulator, galactose operon repressor